jgi:hypothetical protein
MKITKFTKSNVTEARRAINEAVASLKETHGINVSLGNISFTGNSFTTKITVSVLGESGEAKPEHRVNWDSGSYRKHGFSKDDLGTLVTIYGDKHEIVGCTNRRSKYGIIGKGQDGKLYKLETSKVHTCIRLQKHL